jgi:hypothetical protein
MVHASTSKYATEHRYDSRPVEIGQGPTACAPQNWLTFDYVRYTQAS